MSGGGRVGLMNHGAPHDSNRRRGHITSQVNPRIDYSVNYASLPSSLVLLLGILRVLACFCRRLYTVSVSVLLPPAHAPR